MDAQTSSDNTVAAPTKARPVHAPITAYAIAAGQLQVGGVPITQLATRVGQTPFYAYSRELLRQRVAQLRAALPKGIELHYAMKANPMPAVVGFMGGLVDGIDVASAGELKVALDMGANPAEVSFAGPGKRDPELLQAVASRILINVESLRELPVLARAAEQLGFPARVALRVNPDFELKGSGMKMSGGPKQFGVDVDVVPQMMAAIREAGPSRLAFEGFHIFAGSQNLKAESICEAQRKSYELAVRMAALAPSPVKFLNLGGGFGIPYFPGELPLDLAPIGANLAAIQAQARAQLPAAKLVIELGRYFVGEAGIYVSRVVDRKVSCGQVFLMADGGLHHHLAASGNFGQVIRKNYPVMIGNKAGLPAEETASVVGPLCTPLDILADKMELPAAQIGDLVVVFQSGAYGLSSSPQPFLGHPSCLEVLV